MFRAERSRIYWFRAEGAALSFLWPALEIWHYTAVQERTPVAGGRGPFPGKKHSKYWRCFPLWLRPEFQEESINTVWLLWPLPAPTINWSLKSHLRDPVKHVKNRGRGSFKPWKAWWLSFFFLFSLSLFFFAGQLLPRWAIFIAWKGYTLPINSDLGNPQAIFLSFINCHLFFCVLT